MNSKSQFFSRIHFHIRWSQGSTLDWEPFQSQADAEATAKQLAGPHESYGIEHRQHGTCERCATFLREKLRGLSSAVSAGITDDKVLRLNHGEDRPILS